MAGKSKKTTTTKPWERLPNESPKAYDAFLDYLEMGPTVRSLSKVHKLRGGKGNPSSCQLWLKRFNWTERVQAWDEYKAKVWLDKHLDVVVDTRLSAAEKAKESLAKIYEIMNDRKATKTQLDAAALMLGLAGVDKLTTDQVNQASAGQIVLHLPDNGRGGKQS